MRLHITLVALLAASATVPGLAARSDPEGLIVTGTNAEGDVPNRFTESIALNRGFTKHSEQMGDAERHYGFDGEPWDEANGILTVSNLPSAVEREATLAWLASRAWRLKMRAGQTTRRVIPPHGNPVSLEFDAATGLLRQATIAGDWGPTVVTFSDWRRVGSFTYPFHRETLTTTGERTTVRVQSAQFVGSLPKGSLSRPNAKTHAEPLPNGGASIPFEAVGRKKSHIQVDSMINGKPAKLIFDTGAANYITTDAAPLFGVRASGGVNLSGVGESSSTGGYATIDRIALGDAMLRDQSVVVGPSPFPPAKPGGPPNSVGFTGFEFFAEYVTTIDYPARRLHFAQALPSQSQGLRVPFYNDGSHIYVKARIGGVEGLYGLDTGDGGTVIIFPEFAKRYRIQGESGPLNQDGGGVGGQVSSGPGVLDRFSLGGLDFNRLPVRFSHQKAGAFASRSLAGNLGGGILQCFRITIDFPHHLLLLDPAPGNPFCTPGGTVSIAPRGEG